MSASARRGLVLLIGSVTMGLFLGIPAAADEKEAAWLSDYDKGIRQAKQSGKPILLDFYTTW